MAFTIGLTGSAQTPGGAGEEQFFKVPDGVRAPSTVHIYGTGTGTLRVVGEAGLLFPGVTGTPLDMADGPHVIRVDDGGLKEMYWTGATGVLSWGPLAWTKRG